MLRVFRVLLKLYCSTVYEYFIECLPLPVKMQARWCNELGFNNSLSIGLLFIHRDNYYCTLEVKL